MHDRFKSADKLKADAQAPMDNILVSAFDSRAFYTTAHKLQVGVNNGALRQRSTVCRRHGLSTRGWTV